MDRLFGWVGGARLSFSLLFSSEKVQPGLEIFHPWSSRAPLSLSLSRGFHALAGSTYLTHPRQCLSARRCPVISGSPDTHLRPHALSGTAYLTRLGMSSANQSPSFGWWECPWGGGVRVLPLLH